MIRRNGRLFWLILALLSTVSGIAGFYGMRSDRCALAARYTTSCANHFIQLKMTLHFVANEHPDYWLPIESDTRAALLVISKEVEDVGFSESWLHGIDAACPESYRRDRSIGYVYVGDGLRLGDVVEKNILILFCPAESHRTSSEHSHAWINRDGGICVKSNTKMIEELEHAIAEGQSGNVRYSERAMGVLRGELARRQR